MEKKYEITIHEPCHEDWNKMTPNDNGRFCGSCTKNVVDFTNMMPNEIQAYFLKHTNVCGRFSNEQVNKFDIRIPQSVLMQKMPFNKAFLLALFVVMGTKLFSCKNNNEDSLGEVVVVEDSVKVKHSIGVILPPKNSIQNENFTVGKTKYNPNSIQPPSTAAKSQSNKIC